MCGAVKIKVECTVLQMSIFIGILGKDPWQKSNELLPHVQFVELYQYFNINIKLESKNKTNS